MMLQKIEHTHEDDIRIYFTFIFYYFRTKMHFMWFKGVLIIYFLLLIVDLQIMYCYSRCFNFLECHCIMLQQLIYGTTKSKTFSQNVGCL